MFKNISLRTKLILTFLILAFAIAGVSYYQIITINRINDLFTDVVDSDFTRLNILQRISTTGASLTSHTFEYRTESLENKRAETASSKQAATALSTSIKQDVILYGSQLGNDGTTVTQADYQNLVQVTDNIAQTASQVIAATEQGKNQATLKPLEDQLTTRQAALDTTITTLLGKEQSHITQKHEEINSAITELTRAVLELAIGTAALALIIGTLVAANLSRKISRLRGGAERIANGDLSQTIAVSSNDEVGQLGVELNRMRERLKESYRRLALENQRDVAILQSMGEGLVVIDEKSQIVLVNDIAAQMFESDKASLTGKLFHEIFPLYSIDNKIVPPERTVAALSMQNQRTISDVLSHARKDGRKMLVNLNASPVIADKKIAGAVIVMRDVTKEKEVDRMKTEFISLASHQLRTPLSAIKWFTEMLISGDAGKLTSDQADFAKNISDSTERMIQLVNSLLNISRIESGRIMIAPQPTDLKELVGGIINDLKAKTEERKQTLVVSVHHDMPKISIDPRLIGQVYLNLLTNAIKYTPKGGEISVFISKKDGQIISQVTDNGYGIPKDEQSRLFQKFFRATNAVEVETDGTGLGLYLIKAIVESSGGKIWFESEVGKGSTFWFSIPESGMKAKAGEVTLDV